MSANTALVTDAAKTAAGQASADFSAGVFGHITSDWSAHNQVKVYATPFMDEGGNISGISTLRGLFTLNSSDVILALPITATGTSVLVNSPPVITVQPSDQSQRVGGPVTFAVAAISSIPISYQWRKNNINIVNQTASSLVIPAVTAANAGNYSVVVSNANGSVTSRTAVLTVDTSQPFSPGGGSFF